MPSLTRHYFAFGPFVIDTARQIVLRDGSPVAITPKSYDALLVLVENHGRLLSKDELMKALWPDSFVEEANLAQQVSVIRKILGETAGQDRYIVTVPGRGYRFAREVTEWTEGPDSGTAPPGPPPVQAEPPVRRSALRTAALAALLLTLLLAAFLVFRPHASPKAKEPRSLAILPFQSLKQDPESDFLGFSLVDAVITKLGYVHSLAVRPSYAVAKYRSQIVDISKVSADLRINTVLTGTFVREGKNLRITAQLVDVPSQKILWKHTLDLRYENLLTVQDEVAREIVRGLELSLSELEGEHLKPDRAIDPLAYEYYLRGVDLYARGEYALAIGMLEKSASVEPQYALTWAHLGRAYTAAASLQLGGRGQYQKAEAAYQKALSLQPDQIEAPIYLANFFTDTGRVEQAVPLLMKALETNPNHAEAHWELGYAYRFAGLLRESVAECERARRLDPSVKLTSSALNAYLYLGDYDGFLASLPAARDSAFLEFYRGFAEYYKRNLRPAVEDFRLAFQLDPSLLHSVIGKALLDGIEHNEAEGIALMHRTAERILERDVRDAEAMYKVAQAYLALGDRASALRFLRRSVEGGFFPYPYLISDPLLEPLHGDPEFVRIVTAAQQRHEAFARRFGSGSG